MSHRKPIEVIQESESGRNQRFLDPNRGRELSRALFVREIEQGLHPKYHVREIHGVKTPVSNPNGKERDNLG